MVGLGTIHLLNTLTLYSILFVRDFDCNLISVSKLNSDLHYEIKFFARYYVFQDLSLWRMIDNAELCVGLYLLDVTTSSVCTFSNNIQVNSQCWLVHSIKSVVQLNKDSAIMMW